MMVACKGLLDCMARTRLDEGSHKRWQLSPECHALRLEECGDKERMIV
jgi:hypothetical protein